jgi:phenylalanine-4-hydroxylase
MSGARASIGRRLTIAAPRRRSQLQERMPGAKRGGPAMANIDDYTIEEDWTEYSEDEHAIWRFLFERQQRLLKRLACCEYHEGCGG